jgi:hypothetical protein
VGGGIKTWKRREVGRIYDSSYCPLCYYRSATALLKIIRGKERIKIDGEGKT